MPEFTEKQLRAAVGKHLADGDSAAFEPIATGKFNTSYFVRADDRELVILEEEDACPARELAFDDLRRRERRELLLLELRQLLARQRFPAASDRHNCYRDRYSYDSFTSHLISVSSRPSGSPS